MDELHGISIAYEMRTGQNGYSRREASFKASIKNQSENSNDEEALSINKIERGTRKYKGNFPLKCFNCGRIGHFPLIAPTLNKMRMKKSKLQNSEEVN